MNREFEVNLAALTVTDQLNRSAARKWFNKSLKSARNAAKALKEKSRLSRIEAGEIEGLRFQINGERILSREDLIEKPRVAFYVQNGM